MRIVISADNKNGLDSIVSPHFGRCPHFVLLDMEKQEVQVVSAVDNPYYGNHRPGQVPALINSYHANGMLTGGMGRRAITFFEQFNIQPVTGAAGTVRQALEHYLGGTLQDAAPCAESMEHAHHQDDGAYEKDELGRLREEADMLRQRLDEATTRLDQLEA